MWLPMKPKKYISPANWESWYVGHAPSQPPGWPEQTTVRAVAGKLIGSILIGFERGG
jgi:hypothetical protein